jgi:hypothetical protein
MLSWLEPGADFSATADRCEVQGPAADSHISLSHSY